MQTKISLTPENDTSEVEPITFTIAEDRPVERLDKALAHVLPEHSRSRLQGWIEREHVWVNGKVGTVKQAVHPWDKLTVWVEEPPESKAFMPQAIDFEVVDESSSWIVINKAVGMVVHPGAGNWEGTLLNGLLYRYPELAQVPRAGIVHRLDKDTSGLMVVARTITAQTDLVRQLQARTVGRRYCAITHGSLHGTGTISRPIGRDKHVPVRMSIEPAIAPKPAVTHYESLNSGSYQNEPVSMVMCKLETGRTHQIRVHMASLGHPLLGDSLYGGQVSEYAQRQMLHAKALAFNDPITGVERQFVSELPLDMDILKGKITWITG